jgi:DNA repair exonuclease SbcCD ATPase subunit
MSHRIKTLTPFVDKELLINALKNLKINFSIYFNQINLRNFNLLLEYDGTRYTATYDSWQSSKQRELLRSIEKEYKKLEEERRRRLEELRRKQLAAQEYQRLKQEALKEAEELRRLEQAQKQAEERKRKYVEQTIEKIQQKAKEQGYSVKMKKVGNKVKIVLRRNV